MKESVIKQILALQGKSTAELRKLWCSIFDTDVSPHLGNLADQMEKCKKFTNHYMASKLLPSNKLIPEIPRRFA